MLRGAIGGTNSFLCGGRSCIGLTCRTSAGLLFLDVPLAVLLLPESLPPARREVGQLAGIIHDKNWLRALLLCVYRMMAFP